MTEDRTTALARRYAVDVNLGTTAAPDWQRLIGLREFTPHNEPTHEDDSVYDDEGWQGNARTAVQWQAEAVISHRHNSAGEFDPVHRHLRDSSTKFGAASKVEVRYYDIGGPGRPPAPDDAHQGRALVDWAPEGGDQAQLDRVSVTLLGDGKLDDIDNPVGAAQTPQVTSLDPTSGPDAGGNLVTVHGHWFTDVQDVEFGTNSADYTVVSGNRIVAVAPAGTGEVEVFVTTAAGTSSDGPTYTYTGA